MTDPTTTTRTSRLLDPEQIAIQAGRQMPFLRLPQRATVYAERALRLRQLAAAHPMRDYLLFIAELVQAQHQVLQDYASVPLPDAAACDAAARGLLPPLPATLWPLDAAWRTELRRLLGLLDQRLPEGPAREVVRRVMAADDAWLDRQADALRNGIARSLDLAAAPLVAAGLQAFFTHAVIATAQAHGDAVFGRTDPATGCPCCGSAPTASVTRIGADESGHRYLACSVCATQWHYVRIKCAHCESTRGISYQQLEAPAPDGTARGAYLGAVKAECCESCGHYLKMVAMERDPEVEPMADDLASVALDLLVSEAGHQRAGVNLMLLFGDAESS
ncbi:formate dehydrogenase accessory protein FdhE [Aquincola sp. J276]|uniref:formate dehydrogenase accessory protein FdhE n=1 Tax=Aquincola sp. J276 TaxID=2898432 RepID=UPI00215089F4|nr:formate dehydrogenase accessory protein FdhE [Aquincola sp. J276]MCR5864804.1 formate dehydrogenase accessory protein FdhE [Aquincola sp. J276]